MIDKIQNRINRSIECKKNLLDDTETLEVIKSVCENIIECYNNGNKVYIFGNGGSAADAQHFAAELVGRFLLERKALPAVAFTTDSSILTCMGNDYSFDVIFERQVEALVEPGDIVIGITTSGNSKNVLLALEKANKIGAKTIGLFGKTGGKGKEIVDLPIVIKSDITANIQEAHIMIIHIICEFVEGAIYEKK